MPGSPQTTDLSVDRARDLGDLAEEWDRLVDALPVPSPFLRSWWLTAQSDPDRCFLLVHDPAGRLVGGLPLQVRRVLGLTWVRFLGAGPLTPDHLDVLAEAERVPEVLAAVEAWVRGLGALVLDLDGLVERARLERLWGPAEPVDTAPYRLLEQPGGYVGALSSSHRLTLRRAEKKLRRRGVERIRVDADGVDDALAAFRALQEARPGRERLLSALPRLEAALRAGHRRGEVRLDVLDGPDGPYAVMISFVVAGRLSLYQVARSLAKEAAGAGNLVMHEVFVEVDAAHLREIDMLRGGESYKSRFVDRTRTLGRLRVGRGVRGRAVVAAWRAARRTRDATRQVVSATRRSRGGRDA